MPIERFKNRDGEDVFVLRHLSALYRKELNELYIEIGKVLKEELCKCTGDESCAPWPDANGICRECNKMVSK